MKAIVLSTFGSALSPEVVRQANALLEGNAVQGKLVMSCQAVRRSEFRGCPR